MTPQASKETIEHQRQGLLAELRFQVAKASDDESVAGSARQLADDWRKSLARDSTWRRFATLRAWPTAPTSYRI